MNSNGIISFRDEEPLPPEDFLSNRLRVLTVDDDHVFQRSTSFALTGIKILGRDIELIQAYSFSEAYDLLAQDNDIAIALIDVVMETEDAGLRLVKAIRESIGNSEVRLILVTGQPGTAPVHTVMQLLDINDYWTKSELTKERLQTILTTNTRSFSQVKEIAQAKESLESIVTASRTLYAAHDLKTLANQLMEEVSRIFNINNDGLVYAEFDTSFHPTNRPDLIIGTTSKFITFINQPLQHIKPEKIRYRIEKCLSQKKSYYEKSFICLYLPKTLAGSDYVCYMESSRQLSSTEKKLLQVFSMNICGCLNNVALISRLDRLAYEDEFLGLPNKNTLLKSLNQIIQSDCRDEYQLIIIDIDNFSSINTVMGINQGDALLRFIAHRLRHCTHEEILVARIKDDIFALLGSEKLISIDSVKQLFKRLNHYEDTVNTINFSSVTFPLFLPATSAQSILTQTSIALKSAKNKGINQHVIYQPEDDSNTVYRFQLLRALQQAIERKEIFIALQPQICLKTGAISGVEALARWTLSDGTRVSPAEFIPLAETTGLISQLGKQIIEQSCAAARDLSAIGYSTLKVGINLSILQFERDDVVSYLLSSIKKHAILPQQIEVEVTESLAMQNFSSIYEHFQTLRDLKIRIAIDDFGTGFSSLACLSQLPADRLKIDKSFIDRLTFDKRSHAVVKTIVELGERFNMQTIAEGVETLEQLNTLKTMQCHEVQGYFHSKPMTLKQLIKWLKKNHPIQHH